jgi:hypothetical protein
VTVHDENRNLQYYTKNSAELTKCRDIEQSPNIYGMMVLKLEQNVVKKCITKEDRYNHRLQIL